MFWAEISDHFRNESSIFVQGVRAKSTFDFVYKHRYYFVNREGKVESVESSILRCFLIETLSSPVFNWTIPESSAPIEKEEGKAGVYCYRASVV